MPRVIKQSPLSLLGLFVWFLAALFFLYEFFLRTFAGSLAHQIIPDLHLNVESFAIIGSAYYITYGLMQIPVGILADKFGVKIIMTFAALVCGGATFLFAHATGFYSALISRLLMGFGSSFAFVCLLVIAATWFPKKYFGFFAGASQFIGTMGPILAGGPLIALMTASHRGWRTTLEGVAFAGVILAGLYFVFIKNKPRDGERALIYLQKSEALLRRLKRLLRNKQAWAVALYSGTVYVSMSLLGAIWGTEYLQARGFSQNIAADAVSLAWLGYAIACPLLGALSDIAKRRKPTLIFCALLGIIATSGITYLPIHSRYWYDLLFIMLGVAATGQNVGFAAIAEHVSITTRATAMGLNNGAITLSAAVIPPLVSYFIYMAAGKQVKLTAHDFIIGFTLMPIMFLLSSIISVFFIRETYCKPQKEIIRLDITH